MNNLIWEETITYAWCYTQVMTKMTRWWGGYEEEEEGEEVEDDYDYDEEEERLL